MKSAKLIAPGIAAVCLLVATLAWGQAENPPASTKESKATSGHGMTGVEQMSPGRAEQQIKTMTEQLRAAQLKADANSFEKFLADDYAAVHGDGTLSTKAEEVANLRSGALKYEALDPRESKIRVYGNTAVVSSVLSIKGTVHGKAYSGDVRTTRVWVKEKGNWKSVLLQVTRIPTSQ